MDRKGAVSRERDRERSLFPSYSGFELPKYKLGHGDRRVRSHCGKLWAFRV